MIHKSKLLRDLSNDLIFEEDLVKKLADFYNALGWRDVVDKEHHAAMEEGFLMLKDDSNKHAKLIGDIITYIEASEKNEF